MRYRYDREVESNSALILTFFDLFFLEIFPENLKKELNYKYMYIKKMSVMQSKMNEPFLKVLRVPI